MAGMHVSIRTKQACATLFIAMPALIFYVILCRTAVSLPILDDYEIILGTANSLHQVHGVLSHAAVVFSSEHNGYKLMFENSIVWLFYGLLGRIYIFPLVAMGNAIALVIFLVVALMARKNADDLTSWLVMLVPASFLIFQLQYASALNFASSSLQHLAVIAFSLLAVYFISLDKWSAFVASCLASILAIASSPNGFFLAPVGLLMLLQQKQWKWIAWWSGLFAMMLVLYLFRYEGPTTAKGSISLSTALHQISLTYALSFLGASIARYSSILPSVLLGLIFCGIITIAAARRYFLQNSAAFYSIVFIFLNAIAISGLRADSGVASSLVSRYRTYSALMLVFSYFFLVENVLPTRKSHKMRCGFYVSVTVLAILFCVASDIAGARFLREKKVALLQSYGMEWQNLSGDNAPNAEFERDPIFRRQMEAGVYKVNLHILRESVRLGVYVPPAQP